MLVKGPGSSLAGMPWLWLLEWDKSWKDIKCFHSIILFITTRTGKSETAATGSFYLSFQLLHEELSVTCDPGFLKQHCSQSYVNIQIFHQVPYYHHHSTTTTTAKWHTDWEVSCLIFTRDQELITYAVGEITDILD